MSTELEAYSVVAYNTARDSENKIHDNTVARRFGFSGGLVPGVDVYAYMAHLPVARWGRDFLQHGSLQARFLKPVYDGETAIVTAAEANGGLDIDVKSRGELCATGHAAMTRTPAPALDTFEETAAVTERAPADGASLRVGRRLGIKPLRITAEWAARYVEDVRERDPLYLREGLSHPGQLPRLFNWALTHNVVLGPWIQFPARSITSPPPGSATSSPCAPRSPPTTRRRATASSTSTASSSPTPPPPSPASPTPRYIARGL